MNFGDKVTDSVSGFSGTLTARTVYDNGCVKWLVEGRMREDGKLPTQWFDEQRLFDGSKVKGGGPMPLAP